MDRTVFLNIYFLTEKGDYRQFCDDVISKDEIKLFLEWFENADSAVYKLNIANDAVYVPRHSIKCIEYGPVKA